MVKSYEIEDYAKILEDMTHQSDRAIIAVGGALVEYALEQAIRVRLRKPSNPKEEDKLFSESGLFGTFSAKIWGAYFLKIIGPQIRCEIDQIRRIRNQAAHDMNPISFAAGSEYVTDAWNSPRRATHWKSPRTPARR